MIAYIDSSVLARAYLADEEGHEDARALLDAPEIGLITGTWTRIEVSGALLRAARTGRVDSTELLALLDEDLGDAGRVTVVRVEQTEVEERALTLVRNYGVRAMDAWHVAVAAIVLPSVLEPGESPGFASRDAKQASVAASLGWETELQRLLGEPDAG